MSVHLSKVGDCSNNLTINGGHEEARVLSSSIGPEGKLLVPHVRIEMLPVCRKANRLRLFFD